MVVVLQALTEREDRHRPVVGAVILRCERPRTDHVADGSDAPRRLIGDEYPRQSAEDEARERRCEGAADREPEECWDRSKLANAQIGYVRL